LKTKSIRGAGTVAVAVTVAATALRRVTDDSQDGCRYTTQSRHCVATGFQPVVGRDRIRDSH
jgi:hypothetical protein